MELFIDPTDRRSRSIQLYEQVREAIVEGRLAPGDRLTPTRAVAADLGLSRSTVVTSGTGHGIDLVVRVLADPETVIAVEEPGYPAVVELLRSHGLRVVGVPVDEAGIVVEAPTCGSDRSRRPTNSASRRPASCSASAASRPRQWRWRYVPPSPPW